jgi:hypothetical protein
MNRFISRSLFLIPALLSMVLTNWVVDPEHIRAPEAYERGIAEMLTQGKNVTNVVVADASAILDYTIRGQTSAPDVLLLGTSKSKVVGSDFFPGQTFFNAALSGGGLTDLIVIYNLFEQKGLIPREVIVEVDPWLLTRRRYSNVKRFEVQRMAVERSLVTGKPVQFPAQSEPPKQDIQVYSHFLSPEYFQSSLLTLINALVNDGNFGRAREFHAGDVPTGTTYLTDGSVIVPEQLRANLGTQRPLADALRYGWNPPGGVPYEIDARQRIVLEAFLQHLSAQGIKVTLYIPPYHPRNYELMLASPNRVIVDIQRYFEELARANGYQVIGSYDPGAVGVTNADFYDVTHPTSEAIRRIFEGTR